MIIIGEEISFIQKYIRPQNQYERHESLEYVKEYNASLLITSKVNNKFEDLYYTFTKEGEAESEKHLQNINPIKVCERLEKHTGGLIIDAKVNKFSTYSFPSWKGIKSINIPTSISITLDDESRWLIELKNEQKYKMWKSKK